MFDNDSAGRLRRLATQIAALMPENHEEALETLRVAEGVLEALGQNDQREAAKRILAITPEDPQEASLVLTLVRDFLDYSNDRTQRRMHSLRRAHGFSQNDFNNDERA